MDDREGKRKNQQIKVFWESVKILGCAFAGGILGYLIGLPGGTILGAMFAVGLVNIKTSFIAGSLPKAFPFTLQVLIGVILGVKFNLPVSDVTFLKELILPSIFITIGLICAGLTSCLIVHKCFGWDLTTAWLSTSPGRMQDMLIIAFDLKCDYEKILSTHTTRIIGVIIITPIILSLAL